MSEFQTRWLSLNWESCVRVHLLRARFDPKRIRFGTWAYQLPMQTFNVYLHDTPSHLDDESMRLQL